ncbi:MAG: VCBS repeat-containing protein [Pyrinomonadaceae bacterium]
MFGKDFSRRMASILLVSILLFSLSPESFAKKKSLLTVYSNTAPITINTTPGTLSAPTTATLYPSTIDVSGMTGTITKVEVTLKGLTHLTMSQLDMLLVSPSGAKYIFLSDAGGQIIPEDYVYTFSDTASSTLNISFPFPGTYLPTNNSGSADVFPAPAPVAPYNSPPGATFASTFNGASPNGTWSLYVADAAIVAPGSINSGWSLNITTDGAPQTFANSAYIGINDILTPATPYGSTINVSGASGVISNLKVTLTGFSHTLPTDVDILLVSPNGRGLILMSDVGIAAASNVNLTFDDAATGNLNPAVSGTYKPTDNNTVEFLDTFPAPAPLRPYFRTDTNQLSNFNGFNPNGDWRLFVVDDARTNAGSISGGWSLDITTIPTPPPTPATCLSPNFTPTNFPVGVNPTNMAIADFNNDTKADLAVTNQVSNDVSILNGNGDGTFASQTVVTAGSSPYAIAAGKFNADNNFDLAVVNSGSNNVSILLGDGMGGFSAPTNFFVGGSPISIAVGDFNNDTKQDLAVANFGGFFAGTVSILLGNGTGGFIAGNSVRTRTQPAFVLVTDFNNDSNQDLIVANFGADSVSTFLGSGNGTFQQAQNLFTFGRGPVAVEAGNFIGNDSFIDIAIANYNSDSIEFCSGGAGGVFTCNGNTTDAGGANPISLTSADYDGNSSIDLATALSGSNSVKVLTSSIVVGQNPNAVRTADFNGDSRPDLITANSSTNDVSVLINSCQVAKGNLFDFDNDRRTDFSVFRPREIGWYINSLTPGGVTKNFARPTDTIVPADYDGDRFTDFAIYRPDSGLWFVIDRNSKPIHFQQFGIAEDIAAPGDFDGDGKADIAVWRPSEGNWYIRRSIDNSMMIMKFGLTGDKPVVNDYDNDGKADIAVYRPSSGDWYIFRSSDSQVYIRHFGIAEDRPVSGDYDGDGKADIAVWRPSIGVWYVLRSSDDDYRSIAWGLNGDFPVVGDYEGDGKFDYAIWRPSEGKWYVLKSSDFGSLVFNWGTTGDFPLPSAFVR